MEVIAAENHHLVIIRSRVEWIPRKARGGVHHMDGFGVAGDHHGQHHRRALGDIEKGQGTSAVGVCGGAAHMVGEQSKVIRFGFIPAVVVTQEGANRSSGGRGTMVTECRGWCRFYKLF